MHHSKLQVADKEPQKAENAEKSSELPNAADENGKLDHFVAARMRGLLHSIENKNIPQSLA